MGKFDEKKRLKKIFIWLKRRFNFLFVAFYGWRSGQTLSNFVKSDGDVISYYLEVFGAFRPLLLQA